MNLIKRLFALCYMILMFASGAFFILVALDKLQASVLSSGIAGNPALQAALGAVGSVLVVTGIVIPSQINKGIRKNRFITFKNPDGDVAISISAIEDYVQKVAREIADIESIQPRVSFNRRGINVDSAVVMRAGSNIPEITEKMQMEVKNKVRAMLGVEERINMTMHISKITGEVVPHGEHGGFEGEGEAHVPFR